jgi:hypothetical protein
VTATNHFGSITVSPANSTAKITRLAPVLIRPPTIFASAGYPFPGGVLIANHGEWANHPAAYSYQWKRCYGGCQDTGSNDSGYTVPSDDRYSTYIVVVTATNSGGSATATSDPTDSTGPRP